MLSEEELDAACERFGHAIRVRRTQMRLSMAKTAERAQISYPYLSELERGKKNPSMDVMRRVAEALDMKLSELFRMADGE